MVNKVRLNEAITAPTLRLIGLDGEPIGVVTRSEALRQAEDAGYDLAEIAPNAEPPVAKILDWGKYRYEQTKLENKSRRNQKTVELKEVRLGLKIGDHDFNVKLQRARKFLGEGHKVKLALRFRGREITHPTLGHAVLDRFVRAVEDIAIIEQQVQMTGRDLNLVLIQQKAQHAKAEDTQGNSEKDQG